MNHLDSVKSNKGLMIGLVLAIVILAGACVYFYLDKNNNAKDNNNIVNENVDKNDDNEECEECKVCQENGCPIVEDKWTTYVNNIDKTQYYIDALASIETGFEGFPFTSLRVNTDGTVTVWLNKTTESGNRLAEKYGENSFKLSITDVISASYIENNTVGYQSYLLVKKDGTVYALNSEKLKNSTLSIDKLGYNKIISTYRSMQAGGQVTIGVDINGVVQEIELPLN